MDIAIGAGRWQSPDPERGTGSVNARERASVFGARAAVGGMVLAIAGLAAVLSAALPARASDPRGAVVAAGVSATGATAGGIAAPGTAALGTTAGALHGVAGDAGSGVAVGVGVLWWSVPTHRVWHPAAGADSALVYTAVVKTGGRYLAMAEDGSVWISADAEGKSFLRRATAASRPLRAVAQVGGAALVAVGDSGTIARCANLDGVTWTAPFSPVTTNLRGVAGNGVSVVVVGDGGTLLRAGSPGTQWEVVGIDETRDLLAVIADPPPGPVGRYLAVGRDGAAWRGEGDGLTWTRLDGFTTGALSGAAWIEPAAVAVGEAGSIHWSPGSFESWVPAASTVTTDLRAVTLAGNDVIAVGADGTVLWSPNGREWQRAEVPVPAKEVSWGRVKRLYHR